MPNYMPTYLRIHRAWLPVRLLSTRFPRPATDGSERFISCRKYRSNTSMPCAESADVVWHLGMRWISHGARHLLEIRVTAPSPRRRESQACLSSGSATRVKREATRTTRAADPQYLRAQPGCRRSQPLDQYEGRHDLGLGV